MIGSAAERLKGAKPERSEGPGVVCLSRREKTRGREGGARTEHLVEVELRSTGRGGKVEPPYFGLEAKQIKLGYTKNSTSQSSPA
ncbi:hypothetical protein AKJ38_03555 [candidate division MSBL1 archaeon SCGC-AAA259I14]|uniref:Uncharacterized protein n=1 Tax=candidate division MSBL1 archaeon SCGC-AAA259I14 TaxID=1698268 RepID=A0A133UQ42_9EURY|nr:hypothetical protein AKJ38_03555 [candidate division MSBL1 archaeon SCGC-AAA259I14]